MFTARTLPTLSALVALSFGGGVGCSDSLQGPNTVSDEECAASEQCQRHGCCQSNVTYCAAFADADCEQSEFCKGSALRCKARYGYCFTARPTGKSCSQTTQCLRFGWCTEDGSACLAASDADCANAEWCTAYGFCTAVDGQCVAAGAKAVLCDAEES